MEAQAVEILRGDNTCENWQDRHGGEFLSGAFDGVQLHPHRGLAARTRV